MPTKRHAWSGSIGPVIYRTDRVIRDRLSVLSGTVYEHALVTDGQCWVETDPTEDYHVLRLKDVGGSGPIPDPEDPELLGDGTKNRTLRQAQLQILDGTNANTLECLLLAMWNGDSDGPTDNVAKNATTGNYVLGSTGVRLEVASGALSGDCVMAFGTVSYNSSTVSAIVRVFASGNNIVLVFSEDATGNAVDLTSLVDSGEIYVDLLYLTAEAP